MRRIRTGATSCCSTSTSMATTAAASARATRPGGRRSRSAASRSRPRRATSARCAGPEAMPRPRRTAARPRTPARPRGARRPKRRGEADVALAYPRTAEWLEPDGLGGFASGTVDDIRTRRYHALLLHAATPPSGRHVLVNGIEAWLERDGARTALTSQRYAGGVVAGEAASAIEAFDFEPWPCWTLALAGDVRVTHERFARHGLPLVVLRWTVRGAPPGTRLAVRPLLSGRDAHALHHGNDAFRFDAERVGRAIGWRP